MIFTSMPTILAGLFLLYIFAVNLRWFPLRGTYDLDTTPFFNWDFLASVVHHGTLPALSIVVVSFGAWALGMRGMMITVEGEDYTHLARAKGLREWIVVIRHALRGALLPVVSYLGPATAQLISGSIVIEQIFGIPGIGRYFIQGALNRDYTLVMGVVVFYVIVIIILNFIVDLLYAWLNPRIRYDEA